MMNELVLLDFNNFSLERFIKVQGILQPTETNTHKTHTRSTSDVHTTEFRRSQSKNKKLSRPAIKDSTDRIEFARKVVNSTLSILDSWKENQQKHSKSRSSSETMYLYESASLAFGALYEKKLESNDPLEVEKRHVSFILKLLEVQMINQAIKELNTLAESLLAHISSPVEEACSNILATALLSMTIPLNTPESTANVVILSQIALLKALSKYPKKQIKPIRSAVSY